MKTHFSKLLLLVGFLSACSVGSAEFQTYRQAFETQYVEGEKVMDHVGSAERKLVQQRFKQSRGVRTFNPNEARYYLKVGDPPLTGAIRASLKALKDYNDALSGLATGQTAAAVRTELISANSSLKTSLTALGGAAGVDEAFAGTLSSVIGKVIPILEVVERAQNRAVFRKQLVAAHPDMKALMLELRQGTGAMFDVVKLGHTTRGSLGGTDGINADNLKRLEEFRGLLAGWVILIDQSILAMDQAVFAVATQSNAPNLTSLIEASVEIKVLAEAIKTARN